MFVRYDVVWLWWRCIHVQDVAHVGKRVGFVVALYVLKVVVCDCLLQAMMARGPPNGQVFGYCVFVANNIVVLVPNHTLTRCRCGVDHPLVTHQAVPF